MRFARKPGRIDKFAAGQPHGDAANVTGKERDIDDGNGVKRIEQPRTEHGNDGQGEQDIGKGHQHIDAAHQYVVGDAPRVTRNQPDQRADQRRNQRGG